MQQITLHIDNPKIEAILSDIALQDNISIDNIISDLIEKYIYLYSSQGLNKGIEETENDIFELLSSDNKTLQKVDLLDQFDDLNKYNKNHRIEISEDIDISKLQFYNIK